MMYSVMVKTNRSPLPCFAGEFALGGALKRAEKLHNERAGDVSIISSSGRVYLY